MKPKKPRKKKYVPKQVHTPSWALDLKGPITDAERRDLILGYSVPLEAIFNGRSILVEGIDRVRGALSLGFYLADLTEEKTDVCMAMQLGAASFDLSLVALSRGLRPAQSTCEACFYALEVVDKLLGLCSRSDLDRAIRADRQRAGAAYDRKATTVIDPKTEQTWRCVEGFWSLGFFNGSPSAGRIYEKDGSLVWELLERGTKYRVEKPMLIIRTDARE